MKHVFRAALAAAIGAAIGASPAGAAEPIGQVKNLSGAASVTRAGNARPVAAGDNVFAQDSVATGGDGALGITLIDNTTLALGPDSRLVLDEVVFDPAAERLGLSAQMLKGTFSVFAGQIAKLAPEKYVMTTPTATIGIRGTSFLVKVDD